MHDVEITEMVSPATPDIHRLSSLPILMLHLHEHCNCRCVMCDIWQRKHGKELDVDDFARHRDSLMRLGVRQVVLTGGEPLLHTRFHDICEFLHGSGVRVTLLTNGLLLSVNAQVIARHVDEIIVSIDGPEEVHDRIRAVRGAFNRIRDGIRAVRMFRSDMPVHGRSTVQKANSTLLRHTVAAAKLLELDSISFLAADVTSSAFNRELIWPGERQAKVTLTESQVLQLESEVERLLEDNADDFRSGYIVETPEKLRRIVRRFREHLGQIPATAPNCNAPWVSAVMEVDGTVRPCFFHRGIGSAGASTLEQVVNGSDALNFRATLDISSNPTCRNCVCSLNLKT